MSIYTVNGSPLKYDNKWLATNGGTPSSELPSYDSSDAGKALVVNSEGDGVEWANQNTGKVHRLLRYYTNAADADANHPAGDWLHDLDATDEDDPSGHPMVTADQLFDWFGQGENFELYEIDSRSGQTGWSAVYRMTTWQDQSDWWSQGAAVPGKACRLEFHRMGYSATVNYASMIAYIRYKEEDYMRLYEIMPGQSVWTMELEPKLPYYARDWHNGDFLRVKADGSGLEWAAAGGSSVTVDQTYDSTSSNAQSGTAVAEALSSLATVASTGSYTDLLNKPKTKVVLVNAATYHSHAFTWTLTAEQKAKVAGFTNPLVTVQASLDLGSDLQDNYIMSIVVHGVGDSSWYYCLPNGSTQNPDREILKGTRYIQESSTGCYGYPIDYVMCQFLERVGAPSFPSSPSCTFTLIVEECET